jgi:DnaJ-class molecular chaperone
MEKPKDYYRLLGVPRDASRAAIERAYRRLTRELRPGREVAPGGDLNELQAAYETLRDAGRRQQYDESLELADQQAPETPAWSRLRSPRASELRRPVERGTLTGEILLRPAEAAAGGPLPLDIPLSTACAACEGTGGDYFNCPECGGEGKQERRLPVTLNIPPRVREGAVFQVQVDDPAVVSVLLTVHIRPL